MDVIHPVNVDLAIVVRNNRDLARFNSFARAIGQWLDLYEPLLGKPWLNDSPAALALPDRQRVVFLANEESLLSQIIKNSLPRFEPVQPCVGAGILVHSRARIH